MMMMAAAHIVAYNVISCGVVMKNCYFFALFRAYTEIAAVGGSYRCRN